MCRQTWIRWFGDIEIINNKWQIKSYQKQMVWDRSSSCTQISTRVQTSHAIRKKRHQTQQQPTLVRISVKFVFRIKHFKLQLAHYRARSNHKKESVQWGGELRWGAIRHVFDNKILSAVIVIERTYFRWNWESSTPGVFISLLGNEVTAWIAPSSKSSIDLLTEYCCRGCMSSRTRTRQCHCHTSRGDRSSCWGTPSTGSDLRSIRGCKGTSTRGIRPNTSRWRSSCSCNPRGSGNACNGGRERYSFQVQSDIFDGKLKRLIKFVVNCRGTQLSWHLHVSASYRYTPRYTVYGLDVHGYQFRESERWMLSCMLREHFLARAEPYQKRNTAGKLCHDNQLYIKGVFRYLVTTRGSAHTSLTECQQGEEICSQNVLATSNALQFEDEIICL